MTPGDTSIVMWLAAGAIGALIAAFMTPTSPGRVVRLVLAGLFGAFSALWAWRNGAIPIEIVVYVDLLAPALTILLLTGLTWAHLARTARRKGAANR